ncbi:MAG: ATP-binding protein, partial [Chloroflexi bacterium]|nr:ATP-binding protein [Chloroflexota bacterium]
MKGNDLPTFRGRQLNTDSDLRWLIGNQVQEGIDLEYKQEMYGPADEDKREMLRDIAAMANARGGFILIGIKEDEQGIAVDIPGIERGAHAERITSSCLSNIDPRLTPEISEIPLSSGKVVLVISVPSSLSAPHMITFKGLNQFWRRHNRQKAPMDVEEIRDAFLAASDRLERLRKRLAERRDQRRRKEASPSLLFQASPVLLQRGSINVGDLGLRVMLENRQWNFWGGLERTLEGLGVQD